MVSDNTMSKKLTKFQQVAQFLNPTNYDKPQEIVPAENQDAETQELQAKQDYLFRRSGAAMVRNSLQRKTYWEYNRYTIYREIEQMDYDPRIAAALDLLAEESTLPDERGETFTVRSDNPRLKRELETLLFNILDIETYAVEWVRDLIKYGEIFFYKVLSSEDGVIEVVPIPGVEMEIDLKPLDTNPFNNKIVYRHQATHDAARELTPLEIWNIRLVGDKRYQQYGTSHLDKARRIWNQLRLAEDAMLVYRATRAPERRIFKVDVGNIDDKDVINYVKEFKNEIKGDRIVDPQTGNVDLRKKFLDVDQDFFIPVRNSNAGSVIDTLAGASNLDAIADVEYFQSQLFAALRVPKSFIGYEEAQGDGQAMSMKDFRLSRVIVAKFQKSLISGLMDIARQHLLLKGFQPAEVMSGFKISMANPSTQQAIAHLDKLAKQAQTFKDLTGKNEFGLAAMSATEARRVIFGDSNDEIIHSLRQQRVEAAVGSENTRIGEMIEKTGIFDEVDKRLTFKSMSGMTQGGMGGMDDGLGMGGGFGGGGGLGDLGGGMDLGGMDMGGDLGGDLGGGMDLGAGGDLAGGADVGGTEPEIAPESTQKSYKDLLKERLTDNSLLDEYENIISTDIEFEKGYKQNLLERKKTKHSKDVDKVLKEAQMLMESVKSNK